MAQITINGFLVGYHLKHMAPTEPIIWSFSEYHSGRIDDETIVVIKHSITAEVPDDTNHIAAKVAGIEAAKKAALDEYNRTVAALNEQQAKFLAIGNEVAA